MINMVQVTYSQLINTLWIANIILLISCSTVSIEQLFEEFYEKPTLSESILSDTTIVLQKANANYQSNNFKDAIRQYEIYAGQNPEIFEIEFYLGVCYLSDNQINLAIITFENIKEHGEQKTQAIWLLAMSYLKSDDVSNCKKNLKILLNNKNLKTTPKLQKQANELFDIL